MIVVGRGAIDWLSSLYRSLCKDLDVQDSQSIRVRQVEALGWRIQCLLETGTAPLLCHAYHVA